MKLPNFLKVHINDTYDIKDINKTIRLLLVSKYRKPTILIIVCTIIVLGMILTTNTWTNFIFFLSVVILLLIVIFLSILHFQLQILLFKQFATNNNLNYTNNKKPKNVQIGNLFQVGRRPRYFSNVIYGNYKNIPINLFTFSYLFQVSGTTVSSGTSRFYLVCELPIKSHFPSVILKHRDIKMEFIKNMVYINKSKYTIYANNENDLQNLQILSDNLINQLSAINQKFCIEFTKNTIIIFNHSSTQKKAYLDNFLITVKQIIDVLKPLL